MKVTLPEPLPPGATSYNVYRTFYDPAPIVRRGLSWAFSKSLSLFGVTLRVKVEIDRPEVLGETPPPRHEQIATIDLRCGYTDSAMKSAGIDECGETHDSRRHRHEWECGTNPHHTQHYGCHAFAPKGVREVAP